MGYDTFHGMKVPRIGADGILLGTNPSNMSYKILLGDKGEGEGFMSNECIGSYTIVVWMYQESGLGGGLGSD
jgi:hypothetical protein